MQITSCENANNMYIQIYLTEENNNDKCKLQNKLNILNEEYKMLINQKIKEMASCNDSKQREIIYIHNKKVISVHQNNFLILKVIPVYPNNFTIR